MNNFEKIRSILQKYGEDTKNRYLYHYTSGSGLKSIIEENQLWLSERSYMNDILEVEYTKELIRELFKDKIPFSDDIIENTLLKNEMQYVFSTSLEKDSINMWSYYSGIDAYCIVFDRRKLRDYFIDLNTVNYKLFYGQVIYDRKKQNKIMSEVCNTVISDLFQVLTKGIKKEDTTKIKKEYEDAKYIFQFFYSLCKQQGHSCEKEFRYLVSNVEKVDFIIKKGLFVPIYKIGNKATKKIPINQIIIGPNNHETIAKDSLRLFLDANNYKKVDILPSSLRIR